MAAEAVEWQKLGLRNLPSSAGQLGILVLQKSHSVVFEYIATS